MSLVLQGKQLMVFITNAKIQGFPQKLEFWKTFNCHCELDNLYQKTFDEVGSDISKKNFQNIIQ